FLSSQWGIQEAGATALVLLLWYAWPLFLTLMARWLLWPQLLRPLAVAVMAAGGTWLFALGAGLFALAFSSLGGEWPPGVMYALAILLNPIDLGLLAFGWALSRRILRAHHHFRSLEPEAERKAPLLRRLVGWVSLGLSLGYLAALFLLVAVSVLPD